MRSEKELLPLGDNDGDDDDGDGDGDDGDDGEGDDGDDDWDKCEDEEDDDQDDEEEEKEVQEELCCWWDHYQWIEDSTNSAVLFTVFKSRICKTRRLRQKLHCPIQAV